MIYLLRYFIFYFLISQVIGFGTDKIEIPGCPDLASLPGDLNTLDTEDLSNLKCFCSSIEDEELQNFKGINVNCIFGSKLEDLLDALAAIDDVNQTVYRISLDHVEITQSEDPITLEEILSSNSLRTLQELEIKDCRGQLIEKTENPIIEFSSFPFLESITIENCNLENIPGYLLAQTKILKSLLLPENKINKINQQELESVADTLELLDLTSNVITTVESRSISQLENLKTLLIGEHNYAEDSLLEQISQLKNLEILDMTRMDGLNSLSNIKFGDNGKNLRQWILTGCNLKLINETDFDGLENLEELDLRVNLLEAIESGSFSSLKNLRILSLAGNFLREFQLESNLWTGLENLESLDLGWNEIRILRSHSFQPLGTTLKSLSLRHNEKLNQIEIGAFDGLSELQFLNLSGTNLKEIQKSTFEQLSSLEELHLSESQIAFIEPGSFENMKETLEKLSLNNNKLTKLEKSVLKPLLKLEEINLSQNPWICDTEIWGLIDWIRKTYISAAESSRQFFLFDSNSTQCARPYSKQNTVLLELKKSDLLPYDESTDTTTQKTTTTTSDFDIENVTSINFDDLFHVIGQEGNETLDFIEDKKKPKYDINVVRYGQKTTSKNPTNSLFATVTVTLLVIVTIVGILLVVRQNKTRQKNSEKSQNAETTTV